MRDAAVVEILRAGWVRTCQWYEEIDSTNAAMGRALQSAARPELPALYVADRQTSGRGRGDHQWYSPRGCLMCTLAIDGAMLPKDPTRLTQLALVAGVAVAETAEQYVEPSDVHLKWPNDLYLQGRKCGGILIESVAAWGPTTDRAARSGCVPPSDGRHAPDGAPGANRIAAWMIGIGINTDIDWHSSPTSLHTTATCLSSHAGRRVSVPDVLVELTGRLAQWLDAWSRDQSDWLSQWQQRCLLSGRAVAAHLPGGGTICGKCEGIDGLGRLLVRTVHGLQSVQSAEIAHWS